MKIAIVGYGKMGKEIEQIALERGHQISFKINSSNAMTLGDINHNNTDVAIEFTSPDSAYENLTQLLDQKVSCVCGSTGWLHKNVNNQSNEQSIYNLNQRMNTGLIIASNFSLGVNLFFHAARQLATLMKPFPQYSPSISETHHVHKKDAPSGTAITLNNIVQNVMGLELPEIVSHRLDEVPGTHELTFSNTIDEINLKHIAFNRKGFALGAVVAAEFLLDKRGFFSMDDVLNL